MPSFVVQGPKVAERRCCSLPYPIPCVDGVCPGARFGLVLRGVATDGAGFHVVAGFLHYHDWVRVMRFNNYFFQYARAGNEHLKKVLGPTSLRACGSISKPHQSSTIVQCNFLRRDVQGARLLTRLGRRIFFSESKPRCYYCAVPYCSLAKEAMLRPRG